MNLDSMFLINISSDKVLLDDGNRRELLERNSIEDTLWPTLLDRYAASPFDEVFLINGPGGFTNLRVGTLMLNLFNATHAKKIQIYSVDKVTLFAYLVKKDLLPPQGAIYLGQKQNIWLADFTNARSTTKDLRLHELPTDVFLDEVFDPYRPDTKHMIKITNQDGKIVAHYQDKSCEIQVSDLSISPVEEVEAKYMIEPVLN